MAASGGRVLCTYSRWIAGGVGRGQSHRHHRIQDQASWNARLRSALDYESFERDYYLDWLGGMCAIVGVPRPAEEEAAVELARRASAWIIPQIRAAFPGAAETIRLLHDRGYVLHTASG